MDNTHCFTPVTITPAPNQVAGVIVYTINYVPAAAPVAAAPAAPVAAAPAAPVAVPNVHEKTFVEYSETAGGAGTKDINFFKFADDNSAPKYIEKHGDTYANAVRAVVINPANTYLVMSKDGEKIDGGSKSSRKGRKSARKGRKSARKSRRSKGSRSKK